ncbi:hypothetical protein A8950_2221 [Dongia mobilis]|uniref:Lipoprotein n=1 Tax=Dongia mobilis TaxID=578943 RepID=A0A4V3DEZ7_9PROT|nr:hypothetical protein [Dongia mobilis]TDQ82398.1 hypothetical protein A8950_2221 [Dongia mobilis]
MLGTKRLAWQLRPARKLAAPVLALLAGAGLLAACSSDEGSPRSRPCPQVRVVNDASYLTRFAGPAEDLTNTSFEARITRSKSLCYYEENRSTGATTIRSEIQLEFGASRGPNNPDSAARFRYRVGVTGPGGQLLPGDQLMDVEIPFTASRVQGTIQDEVLVYTPLNQGENGDFYRIWISLELTPQELDYNRRNPLQ